MEQFLKKGRTNKNYKMIAAVMVALLLMAGAIGFVVAKYVTNRQKEAEIYASNFHFSSNYLNSADIVPEYNVSDWGSHNVVFYLFNYEQENTALIADTDILYKLTVPNGWTAEITDVVGAVVAPDSEGKYTLTRSEQMTSHCVTMTYTGDGIPGTAKVTVESTNPYKKILQAQFNLTTKQGIEYEVDDKGDYKVITISTNDYYGAVKVTWDPAVHSPDNTCNYMGSWRDSNPTGTLSVAEYTTYTLIFVEKQVDTYDASDFTIAGA